MLPLIALQVLEYMYSEVLQLVTFKSQDRYQTTGLSFPVLQLTIILFCRSDSMMNNVGMLIGPDGTTVTTGDVFTIVHPRPGELGVLNRVSQNILTAGDQGVYTCRIPLQSGAMRDINVGIYPSEFNSKCLFLR